MNFEQDLAPRPGFPLGGIHIASSCPRIRLEIHVFCFCTCILLFISTSKFQTTEQFWSFEIRVILKVTDSMTDPMKIP